ncbi:hypothetical protein FACS189421_08050 [Bacteroidia bacterium]|nr:hypothetical protein FACS189421_08050 [Bacteroidia bacterium]GHT03875.1 hypothetical protein FACS189423_05700 [Bacteroidia bacterium]GHT49869.1 hypothetical protein FACS189440_16320 [Bacteroidia bacterium]GHT89261.1 hypothetical protein FACS189474_5750 [Bacteroidia bacterium]
MKLYHGSTYHVERPIVIRGRISTDFGKGFYTTTNFEQAKRWAISKADTDKEAKAIVTTYEVDDDLIYKKKYQTKVFASPDEAWLKFVFNCRKELGHTYDIVMGPVANDKIYTTINLFESGVLSIEETIARLRVSEYFNQISFHSDVAIKELTFIKSEVVTE